MRSCLRRLICLLLLASAVARADSGVLRILSWAGYVPPDVAEDFRRETGVRVELTLSNNEDMIARLRAGGGAGFDLVHPSHDRVAGAQQAYGIYKPIDLSRIDTERFIPEMFDATQRNASLAGQVYAVPYLWGAEGLAVNTRRASGVDDYPDLCREDLRGRTAVRYVRNLLIAFAFASGEDPFALYADPVAYSALINRMADRIIACKHNFGLVFSAEQELVDAISSGRISAAMFWDSPVWALNRKASPIRFVEPRSGMLGWIVVSAIPAKGGNDAAAYQWINFSARPDIAARITRSAGNFTAARGTLALVDPKLKAQLYRSFPEGFGRVRWYPNVPAGLEDIEAGVLQRIRNAP